MAQTSLSTFSSHRTKAARYNAGARSFHWLIALLIAGMFFSNTMRETYSSGTAERDWWLVLHASMGITIFLVTVLRLAWRLRSGHPAPVPGSALMQWGARIGHIALYGFTLGLPISGFLRLTSSGATIPLYFLLPIPSPTGRNDHLRHIAALFHNGVWTNILLALIGLHVIAALFHQFVLRDGTLRRMA